MLEEGRPGLVAFVPEVVIVWAGDSVVAWTYSGHLGPSPGYPGRTAAAGERGLKWSLVERNLERVRELRTREPTERGEVSMTSLCTQTPTCPGQPLWASPRLSPLSRVWVGRCQRRLMPA